MIANEKWWNSGPKSINIYEVFVPFLLHLRSMSVFFPRKTCYYWKTTKHIKDEWGLDPRVSLWDGYCMWRPSHSGYLQPPGPYISISKRNEGQTQKGSDPFAVVLRNVQCYINSNDTSKVTQMLSHTTCHFCRYDMYSWYDQDLIRSNAWGHRTVGCGIPLGTSPSFTRIQDEFK